MNYSNQNTVNDEVFGRKIIRQKKQNLKKKRVRLVSRFAALIIVLLLGVMIGYNYKIYKYENQIATFEKDLKMYGAESKPIIFNNYDLELVEYDPLDVPLDDEVQEYIFNLSTSYGIDFDLIMALIELESSFSTDVVSETNDYGLMQINKINHAWLKEKIGVKDFTNPYDNVRAGLYILRGLFDRYGDNPHQVLMAYNMGENGAKKLWNKGVYQTPYSINIINKANNFRKEHKNGK